MSLASPFFAGQSWQLAEKGMLVPPFLPIAAAAAHHSGDANAAAAAPEKRVRRSSGLSADAAERHARSLSMA